MIHCHPITLEEGYLVLTLVVLLQLLTVNTSASSDIHFTSTALLGSDNSSVAMSFTIKKFQKVKIVLKNDAHCTSFVVENI